MKKCNHTHRTEMCQKTIDYIDERLEKMSILTAAYGTKSKLDAGENHQKEMDRLHKEIWEFAPEYYKTIAND